LPGPRQHLKYSWWQLISDETRKDHQVLRRLQQVIRNFLPRPVLILRAEQSLAVTATARDGPHEQIPDITRDFRRISGKVGCAGANRREGTQGAER
jgi:hypothetical protein